jgi:hypothetical protein
MKCHWKNKKERWEGSMSGSEWNFLSFVLSGIAFSYGLLMYAFSRRPGGVLFGNPKALLSRGPLVRSEEMDGVTVFSLSEA